MDAPLPGFADHFGINNIPFGIASSTSSPEPTCVTRFEDQVVFLAKLKDHFDGIDGFSSSVFASPDLTTFAALPANVRANVRKRIQDAIKQGLPAEAVEDISAVEMHLPIARVGDFTDFSCSLHHAHNASKAMTGEKSAPPSFFHQPVGYSGRCSSLEISGSPVRRPYGQFWKAGPGSDVVFGPSEKFDYELELACIIGQPVARGDIVTAEDAESHIFGVVVINDWSARDVQHLEMSPLGPLLSKSTSTTVSPWVVTLDALSEYRTSPPERTQPVARYLKDSGDQAFQIKMKAEVSDKVVCESDASEMYWTLAQIVSHQSISGCGLRTGDFLATGTVSGHGAHGCLLETATRTSPASHYVADNTTVTFSARCGDGVGFGECTATLLPAKQFAQLQ